MSTMTGRGYASPRVARRRGLGVSVSTVLVAVVVGFVLGLRFDDLAVRFYRRNHYLYDDPGGGWQW